MKSQTSLLNKALFSHFNGTVFWLTVVFMALNIIALPMAIWVITFDRDMIPDYQLPANFLYQMSAGQLIIGMIFSSFLAVFLLNYLNDEASSDFMHGLPVKRTSILTHALITGVLAIVVPLLITAGLLFIERMIFIPEIAAVDILKWFAYALFVHCVIFAISIFTGFLVNGIFLHLQMILVALFLPLVTWVMIYTAATVLFDGISTSFTANAEPVLNATFPYIAVLQLNEGFNFTISLIWGIAAHILIGLSYVLYKLRRNEYVTHSFNYAWLKNALVAVLTVIGMLAMGALVSFFIPMSLIISVLAFMIGAVVTFIVAEMLFQKNVKVSFSWKTILISLGVIAVFWIVFIPGWNHYVKSVPEASEVESVYVSTEGDYYTEESIDEYFEDGFLFEKQPSTINKVIDIHETAIEEKAAPNIHNGYETVPLDIKYKMKDGSLVSRTFNTLKTDSAALQSVHQLNDAQYDVSSDFLENLKNHPELIDLSLFNGVLQADKSLLDEYKKHTPELMDYNPAIVNHTGRFDAAANYRTNYESGYSSIYNQAILDTVKDSNENISEQLYMDESSRMYTIELPEEQISEFISDYQTMNMEAVLESYDLTELSDEERETALTAVNNGEISADSNKLLLYSYPDYMEPEEDYPAEVDFSILAIQ